MVQPRCNVDHVGMNTATFGGWLKLQRTMRRLSQAALGREMGMDRSHIAKMESGHIGLPAEETRARFHQYFGTTEDDLVSAGVLCRLDFPNRGTIYVPAGEVPPTVREVAPVPSAADVIVIRRDDPRAEVLDLMATMSPAEITRWVRAFKALFGDSGDEGEREELHDHRRIESDTA